MSICAILDMAWKNFRVMKRSMSSVITAYITIIATSLCFFSYRSSIRSQMAEIIETQTSQCFVETEHPISSEDFPIVTDQVSQTYWYPRVTLDEVEMVIEQDTICAGTNDFSDYFIMDWNPSIPQSHYAVTLRIGGIDTGTCPFVPQDESEMLLKTGTASAVKFGSLNMQDNTILITDYMLSKFGICEDAEQAALIGKTVTLRNLTDGTVYCSNLIVGGIIFADVYLTNGHRSDPHVLIPSEHIGKDQAEFGANRCYTASFADAVALARQLQEAHIPHTTISAVEIYNVIERQQIITDSIVSVILIVLGIALIAGAATSVYFYHLRQFGYRQMLRAIGMKTADTFAVMMTEFVIALLHSIIWGTFIGVGVLLLYTEFLSPLTMVVVPIDPVLLVKLLSMTSLFLLSFSAAASFLSCSTLCRTSVPASLSE